MATDTVDEPLTASVVFWRNPGGRIHAGAIIGDGPLLTAEQCQHDDAGDDVTILTADEAPSVKGLVALYGAGSEQLCRRCLDRGDD